MKKVGLSLILIILIITACKKEVNETPSYVVDVDIVWPDRDYLYVYVNNITQSYSTNPYSLKVSLIQNKTVNSIFETNVSGRDTLFYYKLDDNSTSNKGHIVNVEIVINEEYVYSEYVLFEKKTN